MKKDVNTEIIWRAVDACPVCGEDTKKHFYFQTRWGNASLLINFLICSCGIVYADKVPENDEEIGKYYEEYYTPLTEGHWGIDGLKKNEFKRVDRIIDNNLIFPKVVRHLDIGCGYGTMLEAVEAKYGCVSEGCDIRNLTEGYKVYSSLDEIEGTYDLVTCIHTLEHTTDPVGYLEAIRKICSKTLFIEVPSFAPATGVLSPHHLFGFTTHTLFDILEKTGFEVKEVSQTVHGTGEQNKVELQALAEIK